MALYKYVYYCYYYKTLQTYSKNTIGHNAFKLSAFKEFKSQLIYRIVPEKKEK